MARYFFDNFIKFDKNRYYGFNYFGNLDGLYNFKEFDFNFEP